MEQYFGSELSKRRETPKEKSLKETREYRKEEVRDIQEELQRAKRKKMIERRRSLPQLRRSPAKEKEKAVELKSDDEVLKRSMDALDKCNNKDCIIAVCIVLYSNETIKKYPVARAVIRNIIAKFMDKDGMRRYENQAKIVGINWDTNAWISAMNIR